MEKTIEQKAKAYDEAIKRAKVFKEHLLEINDKGYVDEMDYIFPELQESEDEEIRKFLIQMAQNGHGEDRDWWNKCVAWLEKQGEKKYVDKVEPKLAWSEENYDVMINKLLAVVNLYYDRSGNDLDKQSCISFLKSIKDRVQPQPNQEEWSEEDRITRNALINLVEMYYGGCINKSEKNRLLDWLKSIRPQNWTKEDKERYISCLQRLGTGNPEQPETINSKWFKEHVYPQKQWKPSDEHYELEEFAKIVRCNLTGISKAVQKLFEAKYLQLTGNKMYGGFKD